MKLVLNLQEVCGIARISIRDARRMLREGNFPIDAIRTGNATYRFATKKLLEYVDLGKLPDVIPDPPPDTQAEGLKSGALKFWLYRMFDENGSLLYVGQSADPLSRWKQHQRDKKWIDDVVLFTRDPYPDLESVLAAEIRAIRYEKPEHNHVHNI